MGGWGDITAPRGWPRAQRAFVVCKHRLRSHPLQMRVPAEIHVAVTAFYMSQPWIYRRVRVEFCVYVTETLSCATG